MGELVLPCYSSVKNVADNVDVIVASSLARQLAMEIALQTKHKKSLPVYLVQLQSLIPTQDYPHYSQTDACVEALSQGTANNESFLETYLELERFQHEFLKVQADNYLVSLDGYDKTKSLDVTTTLSALQGQPTNLMDLWMVNAVSTYIIPPVSNAGPNVLNVGGLADHYIPQDFEPPPDLISFLEKNNRPICFGYGSMPFGQAEMLVNAAYEAKRPAILVGSDMVDVREKMASVDGSSTTDQIKAQWIRDNICCVANIPYPWLLPHCSMMFSHGGAGVLHATLRAGIPAVIAPFLGDQFFFAKYVEAKGWGVAASENMMKLTKEDVLRSIEKVDACQDACKELGSAMATGEPVGSSSGKHGPELLATAIIQHVQK